MNILGLSAYYHDSAAAIIIDGEIIAAVQEERFTRVKHDLTFPSNSVEYCLKYAGISKKEIDTIVFYEKPLLKFERLLETYHLKAPKGIKSFMKSMPLWIKDRLFFKKLIFNELGLDIVEDKIEFLYSEHHLSHSASAFFCSPYYDSAIITVDGVGEWNTTTLSYGEGNNIKILKSINFPHSIGLLYSAFTYFLGFKVNSGEYKIMGLAPYGNIYGKNCKNYIDLIKSNLISIKDDGSFLLNMEYFTYEYGLKMIDEEKWHKLFKVKKRNESDELKQEHCDIALAVQEVLNEIMLKMAKEVKKISGSSNLCLAGGVALNCVSNSFLLKSGLFKNIYVQPASSDAGGSVGAALAVYYIHYKKNRVVNEESDAMKGCYLGPEYSSVDIFYTLKKKKAKYEYYINFNELSQKVAKLLSEGNVIGWFQGRMEFGPRALGNRSILADPRSTEMQKKLNLSIKKREGFRPFAPSVLLEDVDLYFKTKGNFPYMLFTFDIVEDLIINYYPKGNSWSVKEKLEFHRSKIQAVTHVDFSARIQTVDENINFKFWSLINDFKKITGIGLIINTSFNVRGEPIVCTPEDAYDCFANTEMDYLVLDNYLIKKTEQDINILSNYIKNFIND